MLSTIDWLLLVVSVCEVSAVWLMVYVWCRRGRSVLRVRRVIASRDSGQYQCVASNVVGAARSDILAVIPLSSTPVSPIRISTGMFLSRT